MREFTLCHNLQCHWANQETESFEYHWLHACAMFDVTKFPAILSGIGHHFKFCRYVNYWGFHCDGISVWKAVSHRVSKLFSIPHDILDDKKRITTYSLHETHSAIKNTVHFKYVLRSCLVNFNIIITGVERYESMNLKLKTCFFM